ncbi:hypothetical protein HPULCUR_009489 [Helicostylum pulchrum]|uniref:Kinesin motor domain-containing protein n=1 Tax=Helicostylum pulchrum TaxID=562976 RepID=A0ABP9YAM1_9FUNG
MTSTAVRVALRVRPLTQKEHLSNCTECISFIPNQPQILIGKDHSFTYDYIFDTNSSQQPIYDKSVVPLVEKFVDGQTGSGKTFSMGTALDEHTNSENQGIVPRFIDDLYYRLGEKKKNNGLQNFQVFVSYLELYNEDLVDLLNQQPKRKPGHACEVQIREDIHGQIYWSGVREEPCASPAELLQYLSKGSLCRTTGSTDMNSVSSRSHAIFSVIIKQQLGDDGESTTNRTIVSKFHFVDLAGSERLKRTNASGDRAREGISINSGLLALGNVISALGDDSKKSVHVPYRDSKLTRLLQDSLGGNSQTLMMACVSPSDSNFLETLSTLKYANRARNIKNKVQVNQEFTGSSVEVNQLRSQVARLKLELNALRVSSSATAVTGNSPSDMMIQNMMGNVSHTTNAAKVLKEEIDRLKTRVTSMSDDICRLTTERDSILMERELSQHMGTEEWPHLLDQLNRRPSFFETNTTTLPIIGQYQKTIQELRNELADTQERLTFSESIRAPLMHAAMGATPQMSLKTSSKQQYSSTTTAKRRVVVSNGKKRRNGSTTTARNVTFRSTRRSKVPNVPQVLASSVDYDDDQDIESWLKATIGSPEISESSGLRVDAKHSISNAKSQIDKALKVLDEFKAKESEQVEYNCDLLADDELFIKLQSEDNASLFGDIEEDQRIAEATLESESPVETVRTLRSRMPSCETFMDDGELLEFYENNPHLHRMVDQIQSDIQVNEDLVVQLEKTEVEYGQMRKKFEKKLYSLRDEILNLRREQQLQRQQQAIQQQQQQQPKLSIKRKDSTSSLNNMNHIRQAYEIKMKTLMGQLSDLRRKYTQTSSTIQSSRNQNESMLRALRVNVESLKVEKRRMIKRMKDEAERVKEKLHTHEREIQGLRRKQQKENESKKKLEREVKQMQSTIQKKTDESVVTAEKLKSLVQILKKAVREGGMLDEKLLSSCGSLLDMGSALVQSSKVGRMSRNRRKNNNNSSQRKNRVPVDVRAAKKKALLDNALYQFIQGKQAVEEMKQLLAKRNDLSQRKVEYMSERELLILDEDSKQLSTIDHAFRQVIDENIETVEAEISYLNARIHAIHNDAAAEIMQDDEQEEEIVVVDATRPEKRVTFADHDQEPKTASVTAAEETEDEWLDMDALEERYSLPVSAGPEQSLEMISKLLKSMADDESGYVMESVIDDIVLLRMEEHNNKMSIQQLEKSTQDLRRTLIVMKKAAIDTTIENEKKLKRLQQQQQGSSRRTSLSRDRSCSKLSNHSSPTEDSSDADSAIDLYPEEQYQHVETLFEKIYSDGINGKIDYPPTESAVTLAAENELSPYLRPHPTGGGGVSTNNKSGAPLKPSTSPLANRRDSMSSPEQFLQQLLQTPKDVRQTPPSPLMKPAEFTRYQQDRESSTSSIRSGSVRRRSSVQSDTGSWSSLYSSSHGFSQQMIRASSGSKLPPQQPEPLQQQQPLPPTTILNRRRAFSFQQPPSATPSTPPPSTLRRRSLLRELTNLPPTQQEPQPKSPLQQQNFDTTVKTDYSTHGTTLIPAFNNSSILLQKQRSQSVLAMHVPAVNIPRPSTAMKRMDSSPNNSFELRRSAAANNVFDRLSSGHTQASSAKSARRRGAYRYSSSSIEDLRTQWANELQKNQNDEIA